uniref:AT-hook containing transcription factor 1 n=1 Tax=Laticauda laticaudata TaxID=8630 RepID=A0A8C5RS69_LATLA
PEGYNRCLIAGLLSPKFIDIQPTSLSQEEQLEAVLSTAIQTSSLGLLTSCIKQWTAEEQPNSAPNLRFVLEWAWSKVVKTKEDFICLCKNHSIIGLNCTPLFDGSSNFIDPQTLQSLQRCELLLSNLNTVLNCFIMEAQELTEKGITDLTNKQVVTSLLSQYLQVVIWFCRSNLLPENLEEDMHLPKYFYNYQHIQRFYISCRQKLECLSRGKWNPDCLMIDGMISQLGDSVVKLWQRDGGTGKYPPPTLHALLDLYLLENTEELYKHAITIYLLLDIMHSCPNRTDTSVDSFPTAFAVPIGLVNLIQGFWCLDHNDYENSLSYLFHPATIKLPWQHMPIIQALMCQGEHKRALRYMQMMKPSMISSTEVALHLTVLLYNSCMVEAWNVLRQNSNQLKIEEMLKDVYEICQELGLMEDLLKLPFTETEQECLEKFLQTSTGINNHEFLLVHHLQRANYIPALQLNQSLKINLMNDPQWRERSVARNSILDHYGKVLPRVQKKLAIEQARPYHLPSSLRREILRPKPLSTVAKRIATGNVITKATFISNVLSKIGEVWAGSEQKTKSHQNNSLKCAFIRVGVTQKISASGRFSSPLHSSSQYSVKTLLPKNIARAPELKLLETPPVVKRAKALASTSSAVFPGFTPQSILRSSVRTTPLATPTASPGRSITPPLRAKETKISFMEESKTSQWTGVSWQYNLKFQCHCDNVEQEVTCELLEKDADESSFTERDGELLLCQNNFSLILEGDDEAEVEDSTNLHTSLKSASPESGDRSNIQELTTNSVSTVTSNEIPQNTAEVLPYVPEPIKMAIAENLLDVIKDTRSKEFSAEIIEQSFHESISKKVLNLSQGPIENVHDTNNDVDLNRIENLMPGISSTDHANQSLNISCDDQSMTKENKSTILATPILRRSTRRAKKSTVISENLPHNSEEPQEQQILQIPDFPIRDVMETKNELEISANVHPVSPTFLANATTRSGIRKPNKSVSKRYGPPHSDLPSVRQRTPRITRSVVGNQNSNQFIIDHTIQMTVTPKSATKLKAIALQLAENVISDQEVEPQGKQLSVSPKRGRRRKHGILKVVTQAETISEKLPSPSLVRKSRSRKTSVSETIFKHDMQPNESQLSEQGRIQRIGTSELISDQESGLIESSLTEPPRRKRGRPRKNSLNVSAESQLDLSLLSSPDAASSVHKRNTRSGAVQTSACLPSLETSIMETPKRRSSRVTSRNVEKTDIEKSNLKECVIRPTEAVASEKKSENRRSRITRIRKKSTLPSVSETSREEEHLPLATDNEVESETTDVARLKLGEREETLTHHADSIKRTRLTPKKVKQSLSLDINKTFFFSPPLTKLTAKTKGT